MPGPDSAGFGAHPEGEGRRAVPSSLDQLLRATTRRTRTHSVDVKGLREDLARALEGEVRFDALSRALYATDSSNFRQPPIGVVIPRTVDDIVAAHRICREYAAPITPRGTGTSLSGETVNEAVIVDVSKYLTFIGDPDTDTNVVLVEPGAINEQVNLHTGRWNLVFGPDPSTHAYCSIGGNVGNNSCGVHSVQSQFYGPGARTSDNVESLEILSYDGVRMTVGPTSDEEYAAILAAGGRRAEIYRSLLDLRERYAALIRTRYPSIPRRVSGYNLDDLLPEKGFNVARALVGTEGTCVTVLRATLKLTPAMQKRSLVVVAYPDIFEAGDHIPEILQHRPIGLEGIDHTLFQNEMQMRLNPVALSELPQRGSGWLLVEFGGDSHEEAEGQARELIADLTTNGLDASHVHLYANREEAQALWKVREGGLGATAFPPDGKDHWPGWEDSAVPPDKVGPYLRDLKKLYDRYGLHGALYGHFGQGCIHSRISFDLRTPEGVRSYRSFMEEAADLVVSYGGSLSGEHGDGQQRAELLPKMYGEELVGAFREFKRIWDPDWKMNPGKVVDPYPLDENLKLGTSYNPWRPPVKFAYQGDGGDFAHAALRCVGVGKCRIPRSSDVMCPSFQVLREEEHTTRGRARLLFEMLEGEIITDGWRSPEVAEALDLCLACKGCTNDCPVSVDMPTYKAEFLHHHWKGRLRPRHAYAVGLIDKTATVASLAPGLANVLGQAPGLSRLIKLAGGIAPQRRVPLFAPMTLQQWFFARGERARRAAEPEAERTNFGRGERARRAAEPEAERTNLGRGERNLGGPRVLVWPDTFSNHFHTDVGVAVVETLEAAGFHVVMPRQRLCCGRPLYDYGFLELAERYLRQVLEGIRDDIRAGTPLVGIEPSCLATFKDELVKLLPHDDDARRLAGQSYHFAEFVTDRGIDVPRLERKAVLWGHCHYKATGGMGSEEKLLRQMGVEFDLAAGGCCGLAGSWGFEAGHHDLSLRIAEEGLLPAIRKADADTLIVADGFSCRTQVESSDTGRRALHVAQIMQMARERGPSGVPGPNPERAYRGRCPRPSLGVRVRRLAGMVAGAAALAVGAAAAVRRWRA